MFIGDESEFFLGGIFLVFLRHEKSSKEMRNKEQWMADLRHDRKRLTKIATYQ